VPAKPAVNEAVVIAFRDAAEFEAWLDAHAGLRAGVWLKIAKKGSGVPSLTADEAVDLGLCYGWVSGQRKPCDEVYYLQKYVPRRPRSRWSQVNVAKVEELIAAGRMRPPGLAEVEAAKTDGRWAAAYQSQRNTAVPPDLATALAASPQAARPRRPAPQSDDRARSAQRLVNRTGSWAPTRRCPCRRPAAARGLRWNAVTGVVVSWAGLTMRAGLEVIMLLAIVPRRRPACGVRKLGLGL
jgi:uncharacterized protein YdeI (YjbR/CyaY-like superfamily)